MRLRQRSRLGGKKAKKFNKRFPQILSPNTWKMNPVSARDPPDTCFYFGYIFWKILKNIFGKNVEKYFWKKNIKRKATTENSTSGKIFSRAGTGWYPFETFSRDGIFLKLFRGTGYFFSLKTFSNQKNWACLGGKKAKMFNKRFPQILSPNTWKMNPVSARDPPDTCFYFGYIFWKILKNIFGKNVEKYFWKKNIKRKATTENSTSGKIFSRAGTGWYPFETFSRDGIFLKLFRGTGYFFSLKTFSNQKNWACLGWYPDNRIWGTVFALLGWCTRRLSPHLAAWRATSAKWMFPKEPINFPSQ